MKITRFLLIILFCVSSFLVYSQNSFETKFYVEGEEEFRFVKEASNGDFILLARSYGKNDYVMKLSSEGDSIAALNYCTTEGSLIFFGLFGHPQYDDVFIAPAVLNKQGVRDNIVLLSFDVELNVVDIKFVSFEGYIFGFSTRQIPIPTIKDDQIIFASLVELTSGNYAHMFASVNVNGELDKLHIDTSFNYTDRSCPSDFTIINDEPIQYSYCYFKDYYNDVVDEFDRKLTLVISDNEFKPIFTKELESFYDYEYDELGICGHKIFTFLDLPKFKKLNDTTLLLQIMANNISDDGVAYIKLNKELEIIDDKFIIKKGDGDIRLPLANSMEINSDYIIDCKIKNLEDFNPNYITEVIISKYDHELNLIWENVINQGYYRPICLLSTSDGGCLLAGSYKDIYGKSYLYITKIDLDGTLCVEEKNDNNTSFSIYPNPAKDNISIESLNDVKCRKIEIFSIDGKLCLEKYCGFGSIDISILNEGVYVIKALFGDGNQYDKKLIVK